MNNGRTLKKTFNTKPEGAGSAGGPKLWREDGANHDMKTQGVKNWNNATLTRNEWMQLLKRAKAHQGCRANDDDDDDYNPHICQETLQKTKKNLSQDKRPLGQ